MSRKSRDNQRDLLFQSEYQETIKLNEKEAEEFAMKVEIQIDEGLIKYSNGDFINLLVAGLGANRGVIRRKFSRALGLIGEKAIPALVNALHNNQDVITRRAAAKTLRIIKSPTSLPYLLKALNNDPDTVVQGSAAAAMAVFGEEAVDLLLTVLSNPESTATQSGLASWGIAFIGAKGHKKILKATLSKNRHVRMAAISALGDQINSLADKEAKHILSNALNDSCPEVRTEATILIGQLTKREWSESLLLEKLNDLNNEVRKSTALTLMKTNSDYALPNLKNKLKIEKDPDVCNIIKLAIKRLEIFKNKENK